MQHSILSPEELLNRINKIEQTRLGYFPTPLEARERLRTHLDHAGTLLCKRDDLSGLAFGGNKVRQLEFLLGDAMQQGADTIVFTAAVQSNYARTLAAACSKLGLHCHLILSRAYPQPLNQGNILLDRIVGATVEFSDLPLGGMSENQLSQVTETLRARGKTPYLILYPESEILGALSYVKAATELYEQCQSLATLPGYLVCAAVGATQAGLLLGSRLLGWDLKVLGFSPLRSEFSVRETIADAMRGVSELLEVQNPVEHGDIINTADYVGA